MNEWKPGREGPQMEWKERLPRSDRLARTVCAFANGVGGTLLIGVRDSGQLVGVPDPEVARSELRRICRELLSPPVRMSTRRRVLGGRTVLEARIAAEEQEVVEVIQTGGRRTVYVRDGSSSRPATPQELKQLRRGRPTGISLDSADLRVLVALSRADRPTAATLSRKLRQSRRAFNRVLVGLVRLGLVAEKEKGVLWLTPLGHQAVQRRGGAR